MERKGKKRRKKTDLVFPFRDLADSLACFVVCFLRLKYRQESERECEETRLVISYISPSEVRKKHSRGLDMAKHFCAESELRGSQEEADEWKDLLTTLMVKKKKMHEMQKSMTLPLKY